MVLRTTTNHENNPEKEVSWSDRQVDEGRFILARLEPEYEYDLDVRQVDEGRAILAREEPDYEYDLDVDGHNELLPRGAESTLRNFDNLLTSSAWRRKEIGDASGT
jgi:hypothetical protein